MDWHRGSSQPLPCSTVKNLWVEIDSWHYNYERIGKISIQCLSRTLILLLFVMFCTFCSWLCCFLVPPEVKSPRCINDRAQKGAELKLHGWSEMCAVIGISGTCQGNLRDWKATMGGYKLLCEQRKGRRGKVAFYVTE